MTQKIPSEAKRSSDISTSAAESRRERPTAEVGNGPVAVVEGIERTPQAARPERGYADAAHPGAEWVPLKPEELESFSALWSSSDEGELGRSLDLELDSRLDTTMPVSGEAILAGVEAMANPVPATQISAQQTLIEIGDLVARQILVREATGAPSEVFVQLQERVLPGTELRILRDGQFLTVDFLSRSGEAVAFLTQHQGVLQEYLLQRLEGMRDVKVLVRDHSEGSFEEAVGQGFGQGRDRRREREQHSPS
ncbi:MAG: hypothetical protein LBF21_00130 [Puniceicoccales bacterium]|nr:hypothetical protein [Puniceicoccales bacterium]